MSFEAFIAANRFGLGARPGDIDSIKGDPRGWLMEQVDRPQLGTADYNLPDPKELLEHIIGLRRAIKQDMQSTPDEKQAQKKELAKQTHSSLMGGIQARFIQNVNSPQPLVERLMIFWNNVFTVSVTGKPALGPLAVIYERDAIRPHIFGRYENMLLDGTRHPAMLFYLDNAFSVGPNSRPGQRLKVGLNENLARETLELHSLGVNGGYTQGDVIGLANILTGWTLSALRPRFFPDFAGGQSGPDDGFAYIDRLHEPGPQTVLGKTYAQNGMEQGRAVLRDLAAHPSTAQYLGARLARHFIADDPKPGDIAALANAYSKTGGDLAEVTRTLINLDSVWKEPLPKVKTPYEMMLSAFRATNSPAEKIPMAAIYRSLKILDNAPFAAPSPAGWPDRADDWISGNAVMNRIEWCHALASRIPINDNPADTARAVIGPTLNPDTAKAIARAPSPADGLALMLASAEFQRR